MSLNGLVAGHALAIDFTVEVEGFATLPMGGWRGSGRVARRAPAVPATGA